MSLVKQLRDIQAKNKSFICLGLDLDPNRMPSDFSGSAKAMFDFAHRIIDATADQVCAYKPNLAFFESQGAEGLSLLKLVVSRIPDNIPIILDAKRGDIGNSSKHYASALFDQLGANWVTVSPYMGHDSVQPFIDRPDKGAFVLCLTSNPGSNDFQNKLIDGRPLYEHVADQVKSWNGNHNCGLVVGATHPEQLKRIRELAGDMPLLIPGVGAQGGSLEEAIRGGTSDFTHPAIINVSRSVLYASNGPDFAQRARQELQRLNSEVNRIRYGDSQTQPETESSAQPSEQATETSENNEPVPDSNPPPQDSAPVEIQPPAPSENDRHDSEPSTESVAVDESTPPIPLPQDDPPPPQEQPANPVSTEETGEQTHRPESAQGSIEGAQSNLPRPQNDQRHQGGRRGKKRRRKKPGKGGQGKYQGRN